MPNAKAAGSSLDVARLVEASDCKIVDGEALRIGGSRDYVSLEDLFRKLENVDGHDLCVLNRRDTSMVSIQRQDAATGLKGNWELMRLSDDLFVRISNTMVGKSVAFRISGEGLIEFNFRLSGRLSLSESADTKPAVEVDRGSLLIWRQPAGLNVWGRLDADERESSVTIYLRTSAIQRYLGDIEASMPGKLSRKLCADDDHLFSLRLALIPRLAQLVHDLRSLKEAGPRRLVQAEALVMLILCEIAALLAETPHDAAAMGRITDLDVRCLRQARTILKDRYLKPPTIECLAREVGMGTTKLKNGFKGLFGTTINQFTTEIRMDRARELLRKPDIPISDVAEMTGYEYQTSFTAAFRRHYGVLPKNYRRDPSVLGGQQGSGVH